MLDDSLDLLEGKLQKLRDFYKKGLIDANEYSEHKKILLAQFNRFPTSQGVHLGNGLTCYPLVYGNVISHYKVLEEIRRDSTSIYYRAEDILFPGRMVILRALPNQIHHTVEALKVFRKTFLPAWKLFHSNIFNILEFVNDEKTQSCFLVMEYFNAKTLKELLLENGACNFSQALLLIKQIANALEFAHNNNVLHLRLTPSNIMISPTGEIKVQDFVYIQAINKALGKNIGNIHYMAPEQVDIEKSKNTFGKYTDIWAFGICVYEMLSGAVPFEGKSTWQLAQRISKTQAKEIRRIPKTYWNVIKLALEKDSKKRLHVAKAFKEIPPENTRYKTVRINAAPPLTPPKELKEVIEDLKEERKEREKKEREEKEREEFQTIIEEMEKAIEQSSFSYKDYHTWGYLEKEHQIHHYIHNETQMEFVLIPGGEYEMGDKEYKTESPPRKVTIKPFLISKYLLTQKVWEQIMGTTPWKEVIHVEHGDKYPAVCVSWLNAQEFCKKTKLRLPSEAEWEYACRAGTKSRYYWGKQIDEDYVWYQKNAWSVGKKCAQEVGQKIPNDWQLYDILGNVSEWCEDCWHQNYEQAPTDGSAWTSESEMKVHRGGSFNLRDTFCRSSSRCGTSEKSTSRYIGVRLCASLE